VLTAPIALILLDCLAAIAFAFFHSPRSRRLVISALIIVVALILLIGLWAFNVKTWFPLQL